MVLLVLKVLVPLLSVVPIVRSERSKQPDMGVWDLARRTAVSAAVAVLVAVGLVADHMNQSAAVAAAQKEAAGAREARLRIEETTSKQAAALTAAQKEATEAGRALQRIEDTTAEVVALMRERDPSLTEQEALDRLAEELRVLHKRSAGLEDQLTGLKMYSAVAKLNVLGDPGTAPADSGLRHTSDLIRALEGSWEERDGQLFRRCDQTSLAKFSAAARMYPTFPFGHSALAECAIAAGDDSWRQHAERALEILRHTTQIAGRHPHHNEVYERLRSHAEQQ